jgi:hypothetical protein
MPPVLALTLALAGALVLYGVALGLYVPRPIAACPAAAAATAAARVAAVATTIGVNDSACPPNATQCTQAYRLLDVDACASEPLPAGTTCTSRCYVDGTAAACDGAGACAPVVSDVTRCKGWCPYADAGARMFVTTYAGCNDTLFPIKPAFRGASDWEIRVVPPAFQAISGNGSIASGVACIAQRCTLAVMQFSTMTLDQGYGTNYFTAGGMFVPNCTFLLDDRDASVDTSCITADEVRLDSAYVKSLWPVINNFDVIPGGTGRLCVFSYACAGRGNASAFYGP